MWGQITCLESLPVSRVKNTQVQCWLPLECTSLPYCFRLSDHTIAKLCFLLFIDAFSILQITTQRATGPLFPVFPIDLRKTLSTQCVLTCWDSQFVMTMGPSPCVEHNVWHSLVQLIDLGVGMKYYTGLWNSSLLSSLSIWPHFKDGKTEHKEHASSEVR